MACRKLSQCEINSVLADSENTLVTVYSCCRSISVNMSSSAVKINGEYRLTCEGNVCAQMMNALANGDTLTLKYTGRNCCGTYCVTVTGEPDNITLCGCNRVKFRLSDFITDGVLKY